MNKFLYVLGLIFVTSLAAYSQSTVLTGGNNFSVGLCNNHKVYAWGSNASGQVGQQSTAVNSYTVPTQVDFTGTSAASRSFIQVNAGSGAHGLALDCSGHVWVWGEDVCGQVGNGGAVNSANCFGGTASVPTPTPSEVIKGPQTAGTGENATYLHSIMLIGGGNNFSMAVDSSGNVWSWGENEAGELGNGSSGVTSSTPTQVVKCASAGGGNLTNIVFVQGGDQTAYALDKTGQVWAWGLNNNNNLGNGTTGGPTGGAAVTVANITGNSDCANYVYKGPSTVGSSGASAAALGLTKLNGIKQIAAGDTHGMALDSSGQVWTWGGDWAPGQLGQGINYIPNAFASRVVAPMNFTYSTNGYASPYGGCTGCQYITGAKYIAAGQASSVVVLSDGSVVSFGGLGLYPGSACAGGQELFSGTLGNGIPSGTSAGTLGCNANATRCTAYSTAPTYGPAGCAGFGTPIYVETAAGVKLTNIASVARGDGWYFATDETGKKTYAWGFNGGSGNASLTAVGNWGGELGIGSNVDQDYATSVSLPTGCQIATNCPDKPDLGPDLSQCSATTFQLSANESSTGYTYTWSYASDTLPTATWTTLPSTPYASGVGDSVYNGTVSAATVYYKVAVSYAGACGPCTVKYDTIAVSPITPPWTVAGTYCSTTGTNVEFIAHDPTHLAKFVWLTNSTDNPNTQGIAGATGGIEDTIMILPKTSAKLNSTFGATCPYAIFVTDTARYSGVLKPTAPCASPTSENSSALSGGTTGTSSTSGTYLMINVSKTGVTLNSLQFILMGSGVANFSFSIYKDGGTGFNCNSPCTPNSGPQFEGVAAGTTPLYTSTATPFTATGANTVETLSGSYTFFSTGIYWIGLNIAVTSGGPGYGVCMTNPANWANGQWSGASIWSDNTGYNIISGVGSSYQQTVNYQGAVYNLKFTTASCPAPVKFLAFTAEQQNSAVALNWSTASEQNSSYFNVERSTDGVNFTSIGKVSAAGNSSVIQSYSLTDNGATELTGTIYYRIVEYDINGETTTSAIEAVNTGKGQDVKIIPNPNSGNFEVVVQGEAGALDLTLYNSVGQVIYTASGKAEGANFSKYINIQSFPSGVYYLNVNSPTNSWVKKIVKE